MDWTKPYTTSMRLMEVNRDTWADGARYDKVKSMSVNRNCTDSVPLIESASVETDHLIGEEDFEERYMRIEVAVTQGVEVARYPIMTGLFSGSVGGFSKGRMLGKMSGYSVLKPADRTVIPKGEYATKGDDGSLIVRDLLRAGGVIAPLEIEGRFELSSYVVFDIGSSYLSCVWDILDSANWCIMISEDGTVSVRPKPEDPSFSLDTLSMGLIEPTYDQDLDYADVPNRYYAIDGDAFQVAVNQSSGRTSVDARGSYVDVLDESPVYIDGEDLEAYAKRKLEEASTIVKKYTYTRKYIPGVVPFCKVSANLPGKGLSGDLRILSQSLVLDNGIKVKETAGYEIKEYAA